jgi:hypothetical protein
VRECERPKVRRQGMRGCVHSDTIARPLSGDCDEDHPFRGALGLAEVERSVAPYLPAHERAGLLAWLRPARSDPQGGHFRHVQHSRGRSGTAAPSSGISCPSRAARCRRSAASRTSRTASDTQPPPTSTRFTRCAWRSAECSPLCTGPSRAGRSSLSHFRTFGLSHFRALQAVAFSRSTYCFRNFETLGSITNWQYGWRVLLRKYSWW